MPQLDNDRFHKKAKRLVAQDFNEKIVSGQPITEDEFYVTWFAKVLGNWKACVSTDVIDGQYWEVTYNGEKGEAYVDHYDKVSNNCYADAGYTRRFPEGETE